MLLDCATLRAEPVRLPEQASFLLVDSRIRHAHVDGEYRARREDCETAARLLGVAMLSEVAEADLAAALTRLPPGPAMRCRHVVSENGRVRRAAEALGRGDLAMLGALMNQSHASLRDDMQVSTAEVDRLAAIAQQTPGVFGARMMGGGFGGSVIALVDAHRAGQASEAIRGAYAGVIGERPDAFVCRAVEGAGEIAI
jgi:galactokinase